MNPEEPQNPKTPRLSAPKKSEIAELVATRLLSDKKFLEHTADKLLASKPFTRRIIVALLLVGLITAAVYAGIGFLALNTAISHTNDYLTNQFATYVRTNDLEISNRMFIARGEVTNRIVHEFETERIKLVVTDVASNRADTILSLQLLPEINRFRDKVSNEVQLVNHSVAELTNASAFSITLLAANAGDRTGFNKLKQWASDPDFVFRDNAQKAVASIIDYHNALAATGYNSMPPWGTNPDPKKTIVALQLEYLLTENTDFRVGMVQAVRKRTDLSTRDKVGFCVFALKVEQSLHVLSYIGKEFRELTGFNLKSLRTEEFLDWWDKHADTLDTKIEQPTVSPSSPATNAPTKDESHGPK